MICEEGNYQIIFDEAQDMLFLAEAKTGIIVDCNKAAAEALGWKKEELIGRHQRTLHPDHEHEGEFSKTYRKHLKSADSHILEAQFVTKNGKVLDVAIKAKTFTLNAKEFILASVRDVSAQKKYQKEIDDLARFPSENPNPVLRASSSGIALYINKAGQQLLKQLGIKRGHHLPDCFQSAIAAVLRNQVTIVQDFQVSEKIFQFSVTPVPGEEYVNIYAMDITHRKKAEEDLKRSEQRYHLAQLAANIGSWEWEIRTGEVFWSEYVYCIFGLPEGGFPGTLDSYKELVHPDDRERVEKAIKSAFIQKEYNIDHRIIRPDGSIRWVRGSGQVFYDQEQNPLRMHGIVQDITEEKMNREQLLILSRAVEYSPVSVVITDLDGLISYVNPKFTEVSGYTKDEVVGKNPRILNSGIQSPDFYKSMWKTIASGKEWQGEFCNHTKDGVEYWEKATISAVRDDEGKPRHYVAIKEEITEKRKQAEKIEYLALHDQLTSLYNRRSFVDHLEKAVNSAERMGTQLAILYLDLDGFKEINDNLGHTAGDEVLMEVGRRLLHSVRQMDIVARLGGDEFAVIMKEFYKNEEIERLATRIINSLNEPFLAAATRCTIGVSIGISIYPVDDHYADDLVQKADKAMYQVKKRGKNNYSYYSAKTE
jgi:diguanylate cyclase (GGDEF)-like protein/PAS domain S-box-containing protein